jgi:hypothetical protein
MASKNRGARLPATYRELDVSHIITTCETLQRRIEERFPASGLSNVAKELCVVAGDAKRVAVGLGSPIRWVRWLTIAVALALCAGLAGALATIRLEMSSKSLEELAQGIEAMVNDVVFVGIGLYFLLSLETRIKRKRALDALHVLRSLAHIVDMHQLTKDPERLLVPGPDTASSPAREMTPFLLARYLDYASELLSLISKVGAVYVQHFDDSDTVQAASDVEDLTVGLSRKVWQKITILDRVADAETAMLSRRKVNGAD